LQNAEFRCCAAGHTPNVDSLVERLFDEGDRFNMDEMNRLGTSAAWLAWSDAGLDFDNESVDYGSGVIIGSDAPATDTVLSKLPFVNVGKVRKLGARYAEQVMVCGVAARTAALLGLGNRVSHVHTTSATGLTAIVDGLRHIQHGYAERMICGGVQNPSVFSWAALDSMKVTNRNWSPPKEASRPLSVRACGLVPSSGAGAVVIESLESAVGRGARIYAEFIGANTNCGAGRNGGTMTAPSCDGVKQCIKQAVDESGIGFADIDLINGHLTGTMADTLEASNWIELSKSQNARLPFIHSTKSLLGHTLAAAGAIETAACCLMLDGSFIHPSLNCNDLIPELLPYESSVPHETIERDLDIVIKSSFGFGDVNAVIVLKKMAR
jgi:3-oxoacyl-(acyl-carrier-protein) synthase